MSSKDTATSSTAVDTLTGRVKWFNNKAGYGFITVTDGKRSGSDVFVHHSGINVENQQYKYLVQGEYVDFDLVKAESGVHEFHALNVNGINGGKLMCETRRDFKLARSAYKTTKPNQESLEVNEPEPNSVRAPKSVRSRGEGPREADSDKKEWTKVARGNKPVEKSGAGRGRGRPPRSTVSTIEAK
jgi:CspA family cold shock protein